MRTNRSPVDQFAAFARSRVLLRRRARCVAGAIDARAQLTRVRAQLMNWRRRSGRAALRPANRSQAADNSARPPKILSCCAFHWRLTNSATGANTLRVVSLSGAQRRERRQKNAQVS